MSDLRDPTVEDEELQEVPDVGDTPTQRVAINQMNIDMLDSMLDEIRERRLNAVKKLEQAAKVKADDVRLVSFLKFQAQYKRAKAAIIKLDEMIIKVESVIHKARLLAMACELEVGMETEDA